MKTSLFVVTLVVASLVISGVVAAQSQNDNTNSRQINQMQNIGRTATGQIIGRGVGTMAADICGPAGEICSNVAGHYGNQAGQAAYNVQQRYMGPNGVWTVPVQNFGRGCPNGSRYPSTTYGSTPTRC